MSEGSGQAVRCRSLCNAHTDWYVHTGHATILTCMFTRESGFHASMQATLLSAFSQHLSLRALFTPNCIFLAQWQHFGPFRLI